MPASVLINKKPGDGSIAKLKELLQQTGNRTIVADLSHGNASALIDLAAHLHQFPTQPVNVVIDLWQAPNILDWSDAIEPAIQSGVMCGRQLPVNSTLTVIMAERSNQGHPSPDVSAFSSKFDLVIDRMTVDSALSLKRLLPIKLNPEQAVAKDSTWEPSAL